MRLLIGTYTTDGRSEGIYTAEGKDLRPAADRCISPSFLCQSGEMVYAVNEKKGEGQVSAWRMDGEGRLHLVNEVEVPGSDACHLAVDAGRSNLYAANYTDGSLFVCGIEKDGSLAGAKQRLQMEGHGPNRDRQEGPHMHCTVLSPDGRYLFAADLGTDRLYSYEVKADGTLIPNRHAPFWEAEPGEGPRHLLFSHCGNTAWLITEMGCKIYTLDYDRELGRFAAKQTVKLLEEDKARNAAAAELALSPDGKFLYASVRFKDRIAGFAVGQDGTLTGVDTFTRECRIPRHFSISGDGGRVFVANQDSDRIIVCRRDARTGKIGEKVGEYKVPMPVYVMPLSD